MTELKGCPFCGRSEHLEIVKLEDSMHPKQYKVTCDITSGGCGGIGGYRFSKQEAIEAWNNRHERTCQMIPDEDYDFVTCSNCGYEEERNLLYPPAGLQIFDGNYCPNCGAKVIN